MITNFKGSEGFQSRNLILDSAIKLGVPIIWQRREYDPKQVKQQIIKYYQDRKRVA